MVKKVNNVIIIAGVTKDGQCFLYIITMDNIMEMISEYIKVIPNKFAADFKIKINSKGFPKYI